MMLRIVMPLISRETCGGHMMVPDLTYIVAKIFTNYNIFVRCDIGQPETVNALLKTPSSPNTAQE